jgi:hypothetical protein
MDGAINLATPCKLQSPSPEANIRPASSEIPRLKVYCRAHKKPPLEPILTKMNPVHILKPNSFKICFNIILPYSGDHPDSYPMGTRGSLTEGEAAGAWRWLLTST